MADIRYDFVRTYITLLNDVDLKDFNGTIDSLKAEGVQLLKELKVRDELIRLEGSIEMRYYGQHHEITLPFVAEDFDQARIGELGTDFHEMHETLFGYSEPDKRIEIMNIGIAAIGKMPKPEIKSEPLGPEDRRIVHSLLEKDKQIGTYSIGKGFYKKVVISLKRQEGRNSN